MPRIPEAAVTSYSEARKCFEGQEVTSVVNTVRFGGESMTKQCFHNKGFPWWVCLVVTESKARLLQAEVVQLIALSQKLPVPYLGPGTSAEDLIFSCKRKGQAAFGFMQMMFGSGFVETKVQHDESGNWLYGQVLQSLASTGELEEAKQFIATLEAWVAQEDIPDLQVAFDPRTRGLYVFDPGDPENWGSLQSKHLGVLRRWKGLAQHYRPKGGFKGGSSPSVSSPVPSQPLMISKGSTAPQTAKVVSTTGLITRSTTPVVKPQFAQLVSAPNSPRASPSTVSSSQQVSPTSVGPPESKCGVCGATFTSSTQLSRHKFTSQHH